MFLRPNDENRGRIVSAMLTQLDHHTHPTLTIDVQLGTHFSSGICGAEREAAIHYSSIKIHCADVILPFLAQLLANNIPVCIYPTNDPTPGAEERFEKHVRSRPKIDNPERL